jgi:hypothetical protein
LLAHLSTRIVAGPRAGQFTSVKIKSKVLENIERDNEIIGKSARINVQKFEKNVKIA